MEHKQSNLQKDMKDKRGDWQIVFGSHKSDHLLIESMFYYYFFFSKMSFELFPIRFILHKTWVRNRLSGFMCELKIIVFHFGCVILSQFCFGIVLNKSVILRQDIHACNWRMCFFLVGLHSFISSKTFIICFFFLLKKILFSLRMIEKFTN